MEFKKLKLLTNEYLESIGFSWHTDIDKTSYFQSDVLMISQEEAQNYYEATNELYDMYKKAAQYVIDNDLFHELDIPFNLVDIIKNSWENDVHIHLYGRFDLSGGVDGKPIKLIEFNADTPTALYETAIVQWALLKFNELDESSQFNSLYEALGDNFKRIITLDTDISKFSEYYKNLNWRILFSSVSGNDEEEYTVRLLQHIASEAGFDTEFSYVDEVEFGDNGISIDDELFEFWFKLIPWEDIAIYESELALILTELIENQKVIILNPAYTLLFQSKGMLKILWDLFPNHPLLLETSFEPLIEKSYVEKPCFSREGQNINIVDEMGTTIKSTSGDYKNSKKVYQEYMQLVEDELGTSYQAGVFFAHEACGLGFRKGGKILDNSSKFVPHMIKE